MCSLFNAINLYREEAEQEDKQVFIITKDNIALKNKEGNITYFDDMEEADIERIYLQPDHTELLKVIKA